MSNFQETLNKMYVAPTKINTLIRAQLKMSPLQPIPCSGQYTQDYIPESAYPPPVHERTARTLREILGVKGGFSLIDDKIVMSHSSLELKKRFQVKLIAMVAWMNAGRVS